MNSPDNTSNEVAVGVNAVVFTLLNNEPHVLVVNNQQPHALPFDSFLPQKRPTLEIAVRHVVRSQTGVELPYVEQLYTFGDLNRLSPNPQPPPHSPPHESPHVVSVSYLAVAPQHTVPNPPASWIPWYLFFPWEDRRKPQNPHIPRLLKSLSSWADRQHSQNRSDAQQRVQSLFNSDPWNHELTLERYELLYQAALIPEALRSAPPHSRRVAYQGTHMQHDHRRILATALGRMRAKLRYHPVVLNAMPNSFTLGQLQHAVEAVCGSPLHTQNFRRLVLRENVLVPAPQKHAKTRGRPAKLFQFQPKTHSQYARLLPSIPPRPNP